jgi:nanoRNase/pAp phosphatase (c-di-AMP/oligoRNAs hydrolase)
MNSVRRTLAIMLTLAAGVPALSQAASLEVLEQRCQQAREAKIAPMREAAIKECATSQRSSRTLADCERIHTNFGQGGGVVGGGFRAPMFIDLPECVEFFKAQDQQRSNSSRR